MTTPNPDHSVYVYLAEPDIKAETTRELGYDIHIDFDADGEPVGVEILDAHSVTIDGKPVAPPASTPDTPTVVTICGSMRFRDLMLRVAEQETAAGRIVLMPFAVVAPQDQGGEFKSMLDRLHRAKIDLSQGIIVVSDETGYVGESTRGEIRYAEDTGKHVQYWSTPRVSTHVDNPDSGQTGIDTPDTREALGRLVRQVWVEWAQEQPYPKPSWLVPWESLSDPDKEVDRRIGETLAARRPPAVAIDETAIERATQAAITRFHGDLNMPIPGTDDPVYALWQDIARVALRAAGGAQ